MNNRSRVSTSTLDARSMYLRRLVIAALKKSGRGHLGPSMSLIEILRVLYDNTLRIRPSNPLWEERDRLILSKGHGCLALYAILADKGYFPTSELDTFCALDSRLGGHPEYKKLPGVEASTGSLGHGLPIGVGLALAARLRHQSHRIIVVMGDGELNEGSVWEAALHAAKHKLNNLITIIDYNKMQSYGNTSEVLDLEPLLDKWRAFGFSVAEVDGHDVETLRTTFQAVPLSPDKPTTLVCHTVKGKGIWFAEHDPAWHHRSRLTPEDIQRLDEAVNY